MDRINASFTFFPLPHSVQMYWQTIAYALRDVLVEMSNINQLDEHTIINITNAILTANSCADLYRDVILAGHEENELNSIAHNNYTNTETVFYNQLIGLQLHDEFRIRLQNLVHDRAHMGIRYFHKFLEIVGVDVV